MTEATPSDSDLPVRRYTGVAIALHWAIALAIVGMIALGWNMDGNEALYQLHKSIGITILILTLARIVWRVLNPPPPLPAGMTAWERTLSHGVHVAFYGLMLAMPLTGWLYVSTAYEFDVATVLFGVVSWPDIPGVGFLTNETGHAVVEFIHSKLAWVAIGLLGLHVAGAIKHELGPEGGVFKRMIPGLLGRTAPPVQPARGALAAFGGAALVFAAIAGAPVLASALQGASAGSGSDGAAAPLDEANWQVDMAASSIGFSGIHDGDPYSGTFQDWEASIAFDPDRLAQSRATVTVRTGTAQANKKLYTDTLRSGEWFDVSNHPTATVTLSAFREDEGARDYVADATLAIKDQTVTVPFRFDLEIAGDRARMEGETTLTRSALNLGMQSDPTADWVADEVQVDVLVEATRRTGD